MIFTRPKRYHLRPTRWKEPASSAAAASLPTSADDAGRYHYLVTTRWTSLPGGFCRYSPRRSPIVELADDGTPKSPRCTCTANSTLHSGELNALGGEVASQRRRSILNAHGRATKLHST